MREQEGKTIENSSAGTPEKEEADGLGHGVMLAGIARSNRHDRDWHGSDCQYTQVANNGASEYETAPADGKRKREAHGTVGTFLQQAAGPENDG